MIDKKKNLNSPNKRNIVGSIIAFLLGTVLGGVGVSIMMLREVWQSNEYGFTIEKDDIKRYSIVGGIGGLVNIIIWLLIVFVW